MFFPPKDVDLDPGWGALGGRPPGRRRELLKVSIEFSGDIEFRSGSTVKVFGKYALSITSQNGNIIIQTDINMTCEEEVFDTTCLGGFTQSTAEQSVGFAEKKKNLYKGEQFM